ncbi:MAG: dephospho-CoA kinase [Halobacteriovoraceae bacterium]|jgi:dephospho-CoA kinase|nr:dephospho-CoA kinase [Halobacteriovoraceae bacterium]MBT5096111.1 dephospho-CoA kinase [Halobacteriovoraceae bacterium]
MSLKLKDEFISLEIGERLHHLAVPILGLTGGIATGKSTIAKHFKDLGLAIIDADQLIKRIYKLPTSVEFVKDNFPKAIVKGQIDFPTLRKVAFSETKNRLELEKFLYTQMPKVFNQAYQELGNPQAIIYDVPLLFEKRLDTLVDITLCIYSPQDLQIKRLMERDGIDRELALSIIDNQMSIEVKKSKSDFVVINTGELSELKAHAEYMMRKLFEQTLI